MKTITLIAMTMSTLAGCFGEEPITELEIAQASDGLTFSFEGKVHELNVYQCTLGCDEDRFADVNVGCSFEGGMLAWRSAVAADEEFGKRGPRTDEAPIASPVVYGQKPATAAFSRGPAGPLVDGFYLAEAVRWEDTCKNAKEPCWHSAYRACGYFKVDGSTISQLSP